MYLEESVGVLEHPADEGVPRLVVSHNPLFAGPECVRLLFGASHNPLDRVLQVFARDLAEERNGWDSALLLDDK